MCKLYENEVTGIDRAIALGIAGAIGGITVNLCTVPFGRSVCPEEDGKRVFEMVYIKLLNMFKESRTSGRKNLVE
jgi:hypothetical protein